MICVHKNIPRKQIPLTEDSIPVTNSDVPDQTSTLEKLCLIWVAKYERKLHIQTSHFVRFVLLDG